jgi:hypothetical protein
MTENNETSNLLEGSDDMQDVQRKAAEENLTQVTSIAQEEKRTGQKIDVPNPEELVARASSSLIVNQQHLSNIVNRRNGGTKYTISRKGMNRVINAILGLPTEGVPVRLQSPAEKAAFAVGQNIIRDMFVIMANHAFSEAKKAKETSLQQEQASANVEQEPKQTEGGQNNV